MESDYTNYRYWTNLFNINNGSRLNRRNVEIYEPVVQLFTAPLKLYDDGSTDPPYYAEKFMDLDTAHNNEPDGESGLEIPAGSSSHYRMIDENPNFLDGSYFPDYHKYGTFLQSAEGLPESKPFMFRPNGPPYDRPKFPLDVRRQMFG